MKTLLLELRTSVLATLVLAVLLCGLYPAVVWGAAQLLFRDQANGSLMLDPDGTVRGSVLLAQSFTSDRYFHPRPSSAGTGYDAANSSGSNLGPTSQKLAATIKAEVAAYRARNGLSAATPVPADAVTRSGSGLDPHISPANAACQAARVARTRQLPLEQVRALILQHTDGRGLGALGEPGVNVLRLNRTLDQVAPMVLLRVDAASRSACRGRGACLAPATAGRPPAVGNRRSFSPPQVAITRRCTLAPTSAR